MQNPSDIVVYDTYLKNQVTLSQNTSVHQGILSLYSCGPTVYNYQSIGNMRAVYLPDTIAKIAKLSGWTVRWTLNITDVGHLVGDGDIGEDKIEKSAKQQQKTVEAIVNHYTQDFYQQCHSLAFTIPQGFYNPKATEYIEEQMILSLQLVSDDLAYFVDDGIYFDYQKFVQRYGSSANPQLQSILERDAKSSGNRNYTDRDIASGGHHPYDFALWKFVPNDSLQQWKFSQFPTTHQAFTQLLHTLPKLEIYTNRAGCPGWHSECVCMIIGTLLHADTPQKRDSVYPNYYHSLTSNSAIIDIHTGGEDHIDIHHKNEILQSTALGFPLSHHWVHNKFVMVDGQKMSKSLGNVYQVVGNSQQTGFISLQEKGFDPLVYRLMLMEHHYTEQLNFTWQKLEQSASRLTSLRKLATAVTSFAYSQDIQPQLFDARTSPLLNTLNNNLNTPLFLEQYTKLLTKVVDTITKKQQLNVVEYSEVLGWDTAFLSMIFTPYTDEIRSLLQQRLQAKLQKNYSLADSLRETLAHQGYAVDDYAWGSGVRILAQTDNSL